MYDWMGCRGGSQRVAYNLALESQGHTQHQADDQSAGEGGKAMSERIAALDDRQWSVWGRRRDKAVTNGKYLVTRSGTTDASLACYDGDGLPNKMLGSQTRGSETGQESLAARLGRPYTVHSTQYSTSSITRPPARSLAREAESLLACMPPFGWHGVCSPPLHSAGHPKGRESIEAEAEAEASRAAPLRLRGSSAACHASRPVAFDRRTKNGQPSVISSHPCISQANHIHLHSPPRPITFTFTPLPGQSHPSA